MRKSNVLIAIIVLISIVPMYVPSVKAGYYLPFTVGTSYTIHNIDPANAYDDSSYHVLNQICEGLYAYNLSSPDLEPIPQLASKMGTWNETMDELTIELKQDVTFHDGTPFDANVVKWNFDRIFYFVEEQMSEPYKLYLNNEEEPMIKETQVVDDYTIKFILNKPCIVWESMLAFTGSSIIKPNKDFKNEFMTLSDEIIGTGPFKLIEIEPETFVTFERFEDYYSGPANITSIVYHVISDSEIISIAILNHELHYGEVLLEHIEVAEADPDIIIERLKTPVAFYLTLGVHTIPYEVRRAMSFAFNYTNLLEKIPREEGFELHTPIPDGMQYYNPDIEGLPYYNKTIARQYMLSCPNISAEVISNGLDINSTDAEWIAVAESATPLFDSNFTRDSSTLQERILEQLVDNFAYLGINVIDVYKEGYWCGSSWCGWDQDPIDHKFLQISMGGWGPEYNDAINMIEPLYKTNAKYNNAGFTNDTMDTLLSQNYEKVGEDRADSFDNIVHKLMVENCPSMYLFQRGANIVYNKRYISNIVDLLNGFNIWNWYNVKYTPIYREGYPDFPVGLFFAVLSIIIIILVILVKYGSKTFSTRIKKN